MMSPQSTYSLHSADDSELDYPTYDHYAQIAAAIAFIRQHHRDQPTLSQIAEQVGLSDCHFQRLFMQWAGISPKRFVQYLTLERAKATILETNSLLDLSVDLGLSGPGQLHDLFVTIEAMSPGEFKAVCA